MAFTTKIELATITCSKCGITFGMPERIRRERAKDHNTFYCPNGHPRYYPGETDEEKLRRRLKAAEDSNSYWREHADRLKQSRAAYKGHFTRLKQRVSEGTCPCCDEHFEDLQTHIHEQHPDFNEDED